MKQFAECAPPRSNFALDRSEFQNGDLYVFGTQFDKFNQSPILNLIIINTIKKHPMLEREREREKERERERGIQHNNIL